MNSIYFIIKLCFRRIISYFAFIACRHVSACVHVSVMGSCGTSKVQEFPLLKRSAVMLLIFCCRYRTLPMFMAFSKSIILALVQICHIYTCTHRKKNLDILQRLSIILQLACS